MSSVYPGPCGPTRDSAHSLPTIPTIPTSPIQSRRVPTIPDSPIQSHPVLVSPRGPDPNEWEKQDILSRYRKVKINLQYIPLPRNREIYPGGLETLPAFSQRSPCPNFEKNCLGCMGVRIWGKFAAIRSICYILAVIWLYWDVTYILWSLSASPGTVHGDRWDSGCGIHAVRTSRGSSTRGVSAVATSCL